MRNVARYRQIGVPRAAAIAAGVIVAQLAFAAGIAAATTDETVPASHTVVVTLGKTGSAVKLSKSEVPVGEVAFKVRNLGKIGYVFKICTAPVKTTLTPSCRGVQTKRIAPGNSQTLVVHLTTKNTYEYLVKSARGVIGVGQKPAKIGPAKAPTSSKKPNATKPSASSSSASVTAGKALFKSQSCGSCHTLAAAGTKGTVGPNLDTAKPSVAKVVSQVTSGGGFMPSFGGQLSKTQIQEIAAYVYSATHGG